MRPSRLYVPLDVNTQEDDKILELSLAAETVWYRCLQLSKRLLTDGKITRGHLRRLCDKIPPDQHAQVAEELVAVGLWDRLDDRSWRISAWLQWNKAAEHVEHAQARKREGAKLGNHRRHGHPGKVSECQRCNPGQPTPPETPQPQRFSHSDSHSDRSPLAARDRTGSPETETETENPPRAGAREGGGPVSETLDRIYRSSPEGTDRRRASHTRAVSDAIARGWKPAAIADKVTGDWSGIHDPAAALLARIQRLPSPSKDPDLPAPHVPTWERDDHREDDAIAEQFLQEMRERLDLIDA